MIKLLLILLVGLTFESTGVVLLKKGMTHIGDMNGTPPPKSSASARPARPIRKSCSAFFLKRCFSSAC